MATPLKPWERPGGSVFDSPAFVGATATNANKFDEKANHKPIVPPRPTSNNSGYGPYTIPYAPSNYYSPATTYPGQTYGYSMYSGYGGYRPYSGMYNTTGYGANNEDSILMRRAEERTRNAFQSVESVVGAFASVAMMLESTYFAVHSCFRALLGVAQHFSRLKNQLWSILSAVSLLRRLQNWMRRLLALVRLRQYTQSDELWDNITQNTASSQRLWPIVTFFTVIVGVPWLLWRLLSSAVSDIDESVDSWSQGTIARAMYDFCAEKPNELSISAGDQLSIAPMQLQPHATGWVLVGKNKRSGLVPSNYIEILSNGKTSTCTSKPRLSPSDD